MDKIDMYDVAIIGGGPAGSTAATLLARAGRRVIVFEREKFPRFHIGESLLPFSTQTFDRLGGREKLDRTFLPKFGGEIVAALGIDGTLIRMVRGLDRWFWMIPLTQTRMSIGVVMDTTTFRAMKLSPEVALERCIVEQPMMRERMKRAERVSPIYSAGDYSYRNTK